MMINGECWNIITDEDMVKPPGSFPGSNSAKLTHDFCHLESRYCDDEYTNFSFVDIAGHKIWPFYTSENFQEHLWIWVSPRRFAIISGHPTNEKLNHFYSNKMHEHHILANRTISWSVDTVVNDKGKVIERTIAPSEDTRLRSASHETFVTGFEDKYFASPGGRKEDGSYGKRKHSESTGQARAKQFDPTNTYTARDMQAWATSALCSLLSVVLESGVTSWATPSELFFSRLSCSRFSTPVSNCIAASITTESKVRA